jgi:hypothetical protein
MSEAGVPDIVKSIIRVAALIGFFPAVAIVSVFVYRAISELINAFATYHYLPGEIDDLSGKGAEKFSEKVKYVFLYNMAGVLGGLAVLLISQLTTQTLGSIGSRLTFPISLHSVIGSIIIVTLFTSVIRITVLSKITYGDMSDEDMEIRKSRILGFAFSFWATLYSFLVFIAILALAVGDIFQEFSGPNIELISGIIVLIASVLIPIVVSYFSEIVLKKYSEIPDEFKTKKID